MKRTRKRALKGFVLGIIVTIMFMSTAVGAQVKDTIDVVFNAVNITVNGEDQDVDNFLYKGTTYVPLRAILEIFNKEVNWDGETKTASVEDKKTNIDTWGIQLNANNITSTGITLECNQLDGEPTGDLQTGSYYIIETYNGSNWLPVDYKDNEMEIAWTDEAWIIPMNDTVEWEVDWEWLYGKLPDGKYRIGKEIVDFRDTGDYDEKIYYANFEINESIEILDNQVPDIIEVSFTNLLGEDLLKDGWFTVGEDNKIKINIKVKGNCTSVDMFIKSTGTDTYISQKMVDSIAGGPGENQFEYIWDVPEGTMGHFWIIAYNGDIGQRSKPFNIYNDY